MNINIKVDFQICISAPKSETKNGHLGIFRRKSGEQYCEISNQYPRICRNAKNCAQLIKIEIGTKILY